MRVNKLRSLLKSGGVALGTGILELNGRGLFHTLAGAGMDFAWICSEHTAFNLETVAGMVADAHAAGITPIVRVSDLSYEKVTRLLDTGCQSLIVPHIRCRPQKLSERLERRQIVFNLKSAGQKHETSVDDEILPA